MQELESLLKSFYLVSKMSMTIYDIDNNIIASYPKEKSAFCALLASNDKILSKCHKCDIKAMDKAKQTGKMYIYKCWCGLYETIVPLYSYGKLSGYFMMGQILDINSDIYTILKNSGLNNDKGKNALEAASRQSYEQIKAFGEIVEICAKYLSLINSVESKNSNLAFEIERYLLNHYKEDISINDLVNHFKLSKGTLFTSFKKEFNISIHQKLLMIRLIKAKDLLNSTNYSIKEIALESGFKDSDYFSKAFKKRFGIKPSEIRH